MFAFSANVCHSLGQREKKMDSFSEEFVKRVRISVSTNNMNFPSNSIYLSVFNNTDL